MELLYRKKQRNEGYVEAEVNLFYNQLKEMVRYMPTMIPTMAKYVNFGETTTYGIEGELKFRCLFVVVCVWKRIVSRFKR